MTGIFSFFPWVGGKKHLRKTLLDHIPKSFNRYIEPFLGAGTLFLALLPRNAILSDINPWVICIFYCLQNKPKDFITLVKKLDDHIQKSKRKGYDDVLETLNDILSNQSPPTKVQDLGKYLTTAALFYVICKTNYGGQLRYNQDGTIRPQYSIQQYGKGAVNIDRLYDVHEKLRDLNITFRIGDYASALALARKGDFVYLDPPYYKQNTSKYHHVHDFTEDEHVNLYKHFVALDAKGCKVMLSNCNDLFIRKLYKDYNIIDVKAQRSLFQSSKQTKCNEVLICNYPT